ncbi:hypothetical protein BLA29_015262 [Euroglyphus maynei]|uniref:Uncharacterized protein n=1 Tax=Euroglyphus maynei TaxID=6958 RepID=A0A1Y3B8R9_EURMA|nr:hypothetical protein BLA29_015262 [Euroglyphus maynei]
MNFLHYLRPVKFHLID